MNFKKVFIFFLPYVFIVNVSFAMMVADWKYSMKLFSALYAFAILVPMTGIVIFYFKNKSKKKELADQ